MTSEGTSKSITNTRVFGINVYLSFFYYGFINLLISSNNLEMKIKID